MGQMEETEDPQFASVIVNARAKHKRHRHPVFTPIFTQWARTRTTENPPQTVKKKQIIRVISCQWAGLA